MTNDLDDEGQPTFDMLEVDLDLANLVIKVNDLTVTVSEKERTELLWPLLPALIGSNIPGYNFPISAYHRLLDLPQEKPVVSLLVDFIANPNVFDKDTLAVLPIHEDPEKARWLKAVYGLVIAVNIFWEYSGTKGNRLPDFQDYHIMRLNNWLKKYRG